MPVNTAPFPTLVWDGKSTEHCREVRPFLLREVYGEAENSGRPPWRNLLIQGDNRLVLSSLLHGPMNKVLEAGGGIKLMYCDPPFAVGADFTLPLGADASGAGKRRAKAPGALQALAYRDCWAGGLNGFLSMMYERLALMRKLLAPDGSLYLHCDWRTAPHMRLLLDEIFGPERFLGDIVWHYTGGGRAKRWFSRKHDRILHYAASGDWHFNADAVRVPYKPGSGYAKGGITSAAGKHYSPHPDGTPVDDVWDIPMINPLSKERCGYPTQKPEALLERIIMASSRPGDLVADFFCGSGTAAVCAEKLGRSWLMADSSPQAVHAARRRLLALRAARTEKEPQRACAPFAVAVLEETTGQETRFRHRARLPGADVPYVVEDIRVFAHRRGEHASLELAGFSVRKDDGAEPDAGEEKTAASLKNHVLFKRLLSSPWQDWLDYWSVGLPCSPDSTGGYAASASCSQVLWQSFRQGGEAPLLRSPGLALPRNSQLLVNLVDIFANQSHFILNL